MKFDSLKTKIVFYLVGLFTIFIFIFSLLFYYYFNQNMDNKVKNSFSKIAFNVEEKIENNKSIDDKNVEIIRDKHFNKTFFIEDLGEVLKVSFILNIKKPFYGAIKITKIIDDTSETILDLMLIIEPILLFILILVIIKISNKIFKPIEDITTISKTISIDNFNSTIPNIYNEKEIKEVVNAFNEMIFRLQDGVVNLERFNNDISHELKTPLTIIKGEIDVTLKRIREPENYIKSMKIILEEVEDMKKIIDNLLLLTKYTKDNISKTFKKFDLGIILLESIEKYEYILNQKKIKIEIKKLENIEYIGNQTLFYHIFSNLIDNSIKYSNKYTTIKIELYKIEKIYFIIEDEGIGIPKNEIDKITQKFYRVDKSRNKNIEGFGLGLSIVKNGVNLHNGKLNIFSNEDTGTKIILEF